MNDRSGDQRASFVTVTTLFFTWGFITSMIDPLVPSVRAIFSLNYTESLLTQFAFFLAYGVLSLPGGMIVARWGYATSILCALLAMVSGGLTIALAALLDANPLAAALGAPERSHFRLTLSQAFNSFGTVIGPIVGSRLMLRGGMFTGEG